MTPQEQAGAGAPQPGWFTRNWKWLAGGGCLSALLCCGVFSLAAAVMNAEAPTARVDCGTPGPEGVDCEVKRSAGTGGFKACWDLEITCTNGGVMQGHACGDVGADEQAGTVTMPVSAFSNQDGCDAPASGAVKNLVVEAAL